MPTPISTLPIEYVERDEYVQGDTWQWVIRSGIYVATDGWVLNYEFSGAGYLTVAATTDPDGVSYDVVVTPTQSASLPLGFYKWNAYVLGTAAGTGAYNGQKLTIRRGTFRLVPSFAQQNIAGNSQQEYAEKMLAAIEAELLARMTPSAGRPAGSALQSYAIEGRSIAKIPIAELHTLRAKYKSELLTLSRGGRLPPYAVTFGRRPAGGPGGAGDRSSGNAGWRGVE